MTRIIDTPKALLVEVPEGASDFHLARSHNELWFKVNGRAVKDNKLPEYSYGQPILATKMTSDKIVEVFEFYQGEPPYQPYYKPYGMSEEEYIHEVRIAESKLSEWEQETHPYNRFVKLLGVHNLKPETTVVITKIDKMNNERKQVEKIAHIGAGHPTDAVEEEDEMWQELIHEVEQHQKRQTEYPDVINELKSQYKLIKK